jgi:hypothetical protein
MVTLSLIPFHRGLITAGIVFCFGYSVWEFNGYTRGAGTGFPTLAVLFFVLGLGLIYYLTRLNRFLGYESREGEEL